MCEIICTILSCLSQHSLMPPPPSSFLPHPLSTQMPYHSTSSLLLDKIGSELIASGERKKKGGWGLGWVPVGIKEQRWYRVQHFHKSVVDELLLVASGELSWLLSTCLSLDGVRERKGSCITVNGSRAQWQWTGWLFYQQLLWREMIFYFFYTVNKIPRNEKSKKWIIVTSVKMPWEQLQLFFWQHCDDFLLETYLNRCQLGSGIKHADHLILAKH